MRGRIVLALLGSAITLAASSGGGSGVTAATCTLAPELRAFTINQGLNSYGKITRGKSAVGRFYFGLPACANIAGGAYVQIRSAELTVTPTGATMPLQTGQLGVDGPPATYPNVTTSGTPTLADAAGDIRFLIPGSAFAPTGGNTGSFSATFSLKVFYKSAASAGPIPTTSPEQNTTFTTLTGSRTALSKTVEKQTRALRILAVPGISAPLAATDAGTLSAAMAAVGRAFAVPDGVSNSLSGSGGIRYTINGGALDLTAPGLLDSLGKFCGSPANWDAIKAQLAQFLQSYNNNVVNLVPADRVLGVFNPGMSYGPTTDTGSTCYEGQASLISNEAYARLVPGVAGGIIGQELFHTFGGVPTSFSDGGNHAIHPDYADWSTGDADRAYNVTDVRFLPRVPASSPTNRPMMKFQTSNWGDSNTLLEPGDYGQGYFLCKLGGSATTACKTPGTTGTLTAVPATAETSFVMSGTTDKPGTAAGTKVLESFQADTLPTPAAERPADSPYRLIQKNGTSTLKDEGVQVSFVSTGHPANGDHHDESTSGVFSIAYQLAGNATSVQFVYRPAGGSAVTLYQAISSGAPSISTTPPITFAASRAARVSGSTVGRQVGSLASASPRETVFAPSGLARTEPGIPERTLFGAAAAAQTNTTERVSVSSSGAEANDDSSFPMVTDNGRYIAFASNASNLVAGDDNGKWDFFVKDHLNGAITKIADAADAALGGHFSRPAISGNGQFVAFISSSPSLVAGDTNGQPDAFVFDRDANHNGIYDEPGGVSTTLVSVNSAGEQQNGMVDGTISISDDGRFVAFSSNAANLPGGSSTYQIYVRDTQPPGATVLADVSNTGELPNTGPNTISALSGNGRYLAFLSAGSNLAPGDSNGTHDIFVRDLQTNTTDEISVNSDEVVGDATSFGIPAISDDGRFVAFRSEATNLVAGDTNGAADVFVRDRLAPGTTEMISSGTGGAAANGVSERPSISDDGTVVGFESVASNLVAGDTNSQSDAFVRNRSTGSTERISVASGGAEGNGSSTDAAVSGDGLTFAFDSGATNLVTGDTNAKTDVFVRFQGAAPASADLAITKTDSADPVGLGNDVTYNLKVTNGGPDAASAVTATDTLPSGVRFVSASTGCTHASGTVTCQLGDLANGASANVDIVVETTQVGTLTNQATVASTTGDPNSDNNSDSETTTVEPAGGGGGGGGTGTNLRQITANQTGTACATKSQTGGIGVGIAFDGVHLLVSCYNDSTITVVDPANGSQVSRYTVTGASSLGALAWDKTRNVIWACSDFNKVGQIVANTFVQKFTVPGCFDGLAYDIADDTIWTSPDARSSITHSKTDGTLLSTNTVDLGDGGNSGIAVGGAKLYLANDGGQDIYTSTKDFSTVTLFASFPARLEDLECDDVTFKSQNRAAIWSVDAYDNTLNAWQIPGGTCSFGGGPSSDEQPVTFTASDDGDECDLRADIILKHNQTGVPNDVLAVAVPPDPSTCGSGTATFNYTATTGCGGCEISALVTDGLKTDIKDIEDSSLNTFQQNPVAWISNPTAGAKYYPSDTIVLEGGGWDYQGKAIPDQNLVWTSSLFGTKTGSKVPLKPPNGMWPSGSYQITLTVTDADGKTDDETISITVRVDNDNDRMDSTFEGGCTGLSDSNPFDAGGDVDSDGRKNTDERFTALGPCTRETSYAARDAVWSPDPFDASVDGGSIFVSNIYVPGEPAQVPRDRITISEINGQAVTPSCKAIVATSLTFVQDVYAVRFAGQDFANCVRQRNLRNQRVLVRITGDGGTFRWDAFVSPFVQ